MLLKISDLQELIHKGKIERVILLFDDFSIPVGTLEWIELELLKSQISRIKGNFEEAINTIDLIHKKASELLSNKPQIQMWMEIEKCYNIWRNKNLNWDYPKYFELENQIMDFSTENESNVNRKNSIIADYFHVKGLIKYSLGEYDEAIKNYRISLEYRIKEAKNVLYANSLMNIGICHSYLYKYADAIKYYNEAEEIFNKVGNKQYLSNIYTNLGMYYYYIGNINQSLEYLNKSLKIDKLYHSKNKLAYTYNNLGRVYTIQGKYNEAMDNFKKGLEIRKKLKHLSNLGNSILRIGQAEVSFGNLVEGRNRLKESLPILRQIKNPIYLAENLYELIKLHYITKDDKVEEYLMELRTLSEKNDLTSIHALYLIAEGIKYKENPNFKTLNIAMENFDQLMQFENLEFKIKYYSKLISIELMISKNIMFPDKNTLIQLEIQLKECYLLANELQSILIKLDAMLLEIKLLYFTNRYTEAYEIVTEAINIAKDNGLLQHEVIFSKEKQIILNRVKEMKKAIDNSTSILSELERSSFESYFEMVLQKNPS